MPERDEAGDRACGYRSDDRDHLKDAGHESEEQHERHLQDRETNERHRRHHADEEHLTADVSAKERIHLPDERDELVPLASGQHSTEPLEETRRVAQQEERRDEEHKELKKEMAEPHNERHRAPRHHRTQIAGAGEPNDHRIDVCEPDLVGRLGELVLRVRDERRQGALQVPDLIDRERHQKPAATNYGSEKPQETIAAAAVRGRDIRRSRAPTNGSNTNAKTPAQTKGRTMSPARYTM